MKDRIKSITYGRVFQLKEFESLRIELVCDVYKEENPEDVYDELVLFIEELKEREPKKKPTRTLKK